MPASVPLTRRNLSADPRRLAVSAVGVGLAVMLMLLLDGLWGGIRTQSSLFEDRVGADLYVAQPGSTNLLGDVSVIPISTLSAVRADPGVTWAAPVRGLYVILDLAGRKAPVYLVGSVPGQHGGPWAISSGRAPTANDEIVISPVLARRYGLRLGGTLPLMGTTFRIVGYAGDAAAFMTSFVFVTHAATDSVLRAPATTSYILIGTHQTAAVQGRLAAGGLNVLTRAQVAGSDRKLLTGILGGVLGFMAAVAFAAGTLIIALATYTAVSERRREYGILKALGASRRRLIGLAVAQTFALAVAGLMAGGLLFLGGREVIVWARPQFEVLATAASVARVAAATAAMALVAAVVPARRLAALDPASAYRGA